MGTWNVQEDAVNLLGIRNWKAAARKREEWRRIVGTKAGRSAIVDDDHDDECSEIPIINF